MPHFPQPHSLRSVPHAATCHPLIAFPLVFAPRARSLVLCWWFFNFCFAFSIFIHLQFHFFIFFFVGFVCVHVNDFSWGAFHLAWIFHLSQMFALSPLPPALIISPRNAVSAHWSFLALNLLNHTDASVAVSLKLWNPLNFSSSSSVFWVFFEFFFHFSLNCVLFFFHFLHTDICRRKGFSSKRGIS